MSTPAAPLDRRAARLHPAAVASFLLGLASFALCLLGLSGLPALVLGLRGLRAVNASDGRLRGARLAVAGMALGGLGTLITVAGIGAIVLVRWQHTSTRASCVNNLRQLGVALSKYAEDHKSFPAATRTPAALPPPRRESWLADVLPLLAEGRPINSAYQKLADRIDRTRAWDDPANEAVVNTPVRVFLCPGHPDFNPQQQPGLTHYVGVAGVGVRAAYLDRADPKAGMFGHVRGVFPKEITGGFSSTLMVLETADENGPWLAGDFPTVRGLDPKVEQYIGPGRPFGGLHRGIMNVLWVDGSVRPVSEEMPAELLRRQATIRRDQP
jgi:prepilin-type processing-associated H-X9-DG protein